MQALVNVEIAATGDQQHQIDGFRWAFEGRPAHLMLLLPHGEPAASSDRAYSRSPPIAGTRHAPQALGARCTRARAALG